MKNAIDFLEEDNARLRKIGIIVLSIFYFILVIVLLVTSLMGMSLLTFHPIFFAFSGIYSSAIIGFLATKSSPTKHRIPPKNKESE